MILVAINYGSKAMRIKRNGIKILFICTIVDCGANVSRIGSDYIKYVKNTPTGVVTGNFMNQSVFMGMGVRVPIDNTAGVGYICDKGSISKIRIAKD